MGDQRTTVAVDRRSLRLVRLRARLPRLVLLSTCAILIVLGLRTLLTGPPAAPAQPTSRAQAPDQAVAAFAESFTRAYLSYRADDPAARERSLRPFISTDLDPDSGLQPPPGRSQQTLWTTAGAIRQAGSRRWLVNVAIATETTPVLRHLSVPVARSQSGALVVDDYPALIGPPARAKESPRRDESELTDQELADVVTRALGNYLRGARENLRADLVPGARVATPTPPLRLESVETLTWRRPDRFLAASIQARDQRGARMRLSFLLTVERRERWYLRAVNEPQTKGRIP